MHLSDFGVIYFFSLPVIGHESIDLDLYIGGLGIDCLGETEGGHHPPGQLAKQDECLALSKAPAGAVG
jgi:hypothetical protein